ncbi:MAG: hypothetical protein NTW15_04115, partial [Burkholderiales bacterium]|nr:hypothetical protein [Burkholderiales bacterium]
WPVLASRTASSLNSSVYRALVVPVTSVLLAVHFELLSKGSGFQGQGQAVASSEGRTPGFARGARLAQAPDGPAQSVRNGLKDSDAERRCAVRSRSFLL